MCKDRQHNGLQSLDRELADGEDLAVREYVEVRHDNLPDIVDAGNIHEGGLHEPAHGECIDLGENLALSGGPGVRRGREHGAVEVLEHADRELC